MRLLDLASLDGTVVAMNYTIVFQEKLGELPLSVFLLCTAIAIERPYYATARLFEHIGGPNLWQYYEFVIGIGVFVGIANAWHMRPLAAARGMSPNRASAIWLTQMLFIYAVLMFFLVGGNYTR